MAGPISEGFTLDPPGYERLSAWTHVLMHLLNAHANFEKIRDQPSIEGDLENIAQQQANFVAGLMAYGRCYASSAPGIPQLHGKKVFAGSEEGMAIHLRMIELRNKFAAHTEQTDLLRLTLAVKDEGERVVVRHLITNALPLNEIDGFLDVVAHTQHFATVELNKQLGHLETKIGKTIEFD